MTDREEIIFKTALGVLGDADVALAEAMLHAMIQTRLGGHVTVAELDLTLAKLDGDRLATGLPGSLGRRRWMITDEGRHLLSQLNK